MNLGSRVLILVSGKDGTRRTDIAHLLAGGAAYLSTVSEHTENTSVPSYHTKTVVLSSLDCFEEKGKWEYDYARIDAARRDVERRCTLAMQRGVAIIIVDDTMIEKWEARSLINLAKAYSYEVIHLTTRDNREQVQDVRRRQGKRSISEAVHKSHGNVNWALEMSDGDFVNLEDHRGHLINPPSGEPELAHEIVPADDRVFFRVTHVNNTVDTTWRFLMKVTEPALKMRAARELVEAVFLGAESEILCTRSMDADTLKKRAAEIGIKITV